MTAPQDVVSLDIYKDEIITISNNNSVTFTPLNEDVSAFCSYGHLGHVFRYLLFLIDLCLPSVSTILFEIQEFNYQISSHLLCHFTYQPASYIRMRRGRVVFVCIEHISIYIKNIYGYPYIYIYAIFYSSNVFGSWEVSGNS